MTVAVFLVSLLGAMALGLLISALVRTAMATESPPEACGRRGTVAFHT